MNDETTFATTGIRCPKQSLPVPQLDHMLHYQPTPWCLCRFEWPFPPLLGFLYVKADKSKQGVERRTASEYTTRPLRPTTTRQDKTRQTRSELMAVPDNHRPTLEPHGDVRLVSRWPFPPLLGFLCVKSDKRNQGVERRTASGSTQHTASMDKDKTYKVCGVVAQQKAV